MSKLVKIIESVAESVKEEIADARCVGDDYCIVAINQYGCDIEVTVGANRETEVIIYHYDADGQMNEHQSPLLEERLENEMPDWYSVEPTPDPRNDYEIDPSMAKGWFFTKW